MDLAAARALVDRCFAWDNHSCMPLRPGDITFLPQLARARAAGWDAVTVNIGFGEQGPDEHLAMLDHFRDWFGAQPGYRLAHGAADLDRARAEGELAIMFDIEGAGAVGDHANFVPRYAVGGVRWMLLAYNRENAAAYGCLDAKDQGLKPYGRALVRELEKAGVTVCCTHTGHRSARDVLRMAARPVIFSHSNCAARRPHPRNIPDDLIRACAETGGVVGICGLGDFLVAKGGDVFEALIAHIDHAVSLVGPAHVGLSLDYVYDQQDLLDYIHAHRAMFPPGFDESAPMVEPEALPLVVGALSARGYTGGDIALILGENWRRVLFASAEAEPASDGTSCSTPN